MRNKILAIVRDTIPYVKELRTTAGLVTACILWQQLDYWFAMPDHTDGFYKFLEPSSHSNYKIGDSWIEELAFSKDEFRAAFDKIGIRYQSKTAYMREPDPFSSKFFCSYHDKIKGLTFYFRNHDLVDSTLDDIFVVNRQSQSTVNRQSQSTEIGKPNSRRSTIPIPIIDTETTAEITTETSSSEMTPPSKPPRKLIHHPDLFARCWKGYESRLEEAAKDFEAAAVYLIADQIDYQKFVQPHKSNRINSPLGFLLMHFRGQLPGGYMPWEGYSIDWREQVAARVKAHSANIPSFSYVAEDTDVLDERYQAALGSFSFMPDSDEAKLKAGIEKSVEAGEDCRMATIRIVEGFKKLAANLTANLT